MLAVAVVMYFELLEFNSINFPHLFSDELFSVLPNAQIKKLEKHVDNTGNVCNTITSFESIKILPKAENNTQIYLPLTALIDCSLIEKTKQIREDVTSNENLGKHIIEDVTKKHLD